MKFPENTSFTLIYQASRDGFGLKDFHSKCDGIFNTLIVIQSTDSFVMGGFTAADWSQNNQSDTYHYDNNAFIFSLINPLNQSFKMNVNKPDSATYMGLDHIDGIVNQILGFGQSDLFLNDYSNLNINYGWKNDILSYDLPQSLAGNGSILIGGDFFISAQVEVFVVDGNKYLFLKLLNMN